MVKKFQKKFGSKKHIRKYKQDDIKNLLEDRKNKLADLKPEDVNSFGDLPISRSTLNGLTDEDFTEPTKIQRESLIHSLAGLDVVGEAKTGSGKTLAFIIPLLEKLFCQRWSPHDGLGALIITPTRELAYQIHEVINKVGKNHHFSVGLIIGGKDLRFEWARVGMCNIMICTPGRILQHMTENPHFNSDNVQMLILDEADQCLSMGFAETMNIILRQLPSERQTLLFSATQTRDVADLVRAGCQDPVHCLAHEHSSTATPESLKESYITCEDHEKNKFLYSFLKNHLKRKILIFLSTCKQVKYVSEVMNRLQPGITVGGLHGDMHQLRRMRVFDEFKRKKFMALIATDVAARGLDIPSVDWVVQIDCPEDVTTYIHRAGRTARFVKDGESLLLLTPTQEEAMVANLQAKNIPIEKIAVDDSRTTDISNSLESIITKYPELKEDAIRAFKAYLKYFCFMKDKKVFNVASIDSNKYAWSLGLREAPRVRFIEKKLKNQLRPKDPDKSADSDDDDASDLPSVKVPIEENTVDYKCDIFKSISESITNHKLFKHFEDIVKKEITQRNRKKIDKSSKRIVLNKITFDTEGNPLSQDEPATVNKEELEQEEKIEMDNEFDDPFTAMSQELKSEDKQDNERHKDKKRTLRRQEKEKVKTKKAEMEERRVELKKQEEEEEEDYEDGSEVESDLDPMTQMLIDELPDPDEVYSPEKGDTPEKEDREETSDKSADELKQTEPRKKKGLKRMAKEASKKAKKARLEGPSDITSMDMADKEALALYLLKNKR